MITEFPHLALSGWPFTVVPRKEYCTFLAGRPQLRDDIGSLLRFLSRRDTSSIHVLWSWLGAGKTHSLFFLANEAERLSANSPAISIIPMYTEFPKSAKSFVDVYRAVVPNFVNSRLTEAFLEVSTNSQSQSLQRDLLVNAPDLATALRVLAIESNVMKQAIAMRWLRGDQLPIAEFRKIGISQKLSSTDQAIQVFTLLIHILFKGAQLQGKAGVRVVWLLDEFQRLLAGGRRLIADVNAGLHTLFNSCPVGLTQIISFSGPPKERSLPPCFSPELRDRIGATKVMVLPPLQPREALLFVREVLEHFRTPGDTVLSPFYPFTEDTCQQVIAHLAKQTELRPRVLMHAFNAILEACEANIEAGELEVIKPNVAHEILREYVIMSADEDIG